MPSVLSLHDEGVAGAPVDIEMATPSPASSSSPSVDVAAEPTEARGRSGSAFDSPLTRSSFYTKAFGDSFHPVTLEFSDIRYSVDVPSMSKAGAMEKKHILKGISGYAKPGELLAVMGPSGGGKTSLLNILSARISNVNGDILVNGRPRGEDKSLKRRIALVMQEDVFLPHLTVREQLSFSARLRLPDSLSREDKERRVDEIIDLLGLEKCANTRMGDGFMIRGVSGGERKRTNVGTELITEPSLLVLDECTSGLDSSTALGLIQTLRDLAAEGRTVVTSIHQPSSAMYDMFDKLLLVADGHVVYYGRADQALAYFKSIGFECPWGYAAADYMLDILNGVVHDKDGNPPDTDKLAEQFAAHAQETAAFQIEIDEEEREAEKAICIASQREEAEKHSRYAVSRWAQFLILIERAWLNRKGEGIRALYFWQNLITSIIVGLLWLRITREEDTIQDRTGAIFFFQIYWTFFPLYQNMMRFVQDRGVLNKDRASGAYSVLAYFAGKTLSEVPLELFYPTYSIIISYFMFGLDGGADRFFIFFFVMLLNALVSQSLGLLFSAIFTDMEKSLVIMATVTLAMMLVGGFYIQNMPVWIDWIKWLSYMKFCYNALMLNEFNASTEFTCAESSKYDVCATNGIITGPDVQDELSIDTFSLGESVAMLALYGVIFRAAAYYALRHLNRPRL